MFRLPPHLERKRNQSAKASTKSTGGAVPSPAVMGGSKAQAYHQGVLKVAGDPFKREEEGGFGGQALEIYASRQAAMSDWWRASAGEGSRYSDGMDVTSRTSQAGRGGYGGDQTRSGLECLRRGPSTVVRPMRYESLSAGGTWSHTGFGGRASDEISDLSTTSATSSVLADGFRGFGRGNSGGSDTLPGGSTAATITRDGSLTDDESRLQAGWRALTMPSTSSQESAAVQVRETSLTFVPPPGLYMQNDFGETATSYGSAASAVPEIEPRSSSGFYPYISEQVLKTLSESVAALSVEEFSGERNSIGNAASHGEDVPFSVGVGDGGEPKMQTGIVTATTRSSTSLHVEAEEECGGSSNPTEDLRSGRASSVVSNTSQQHLEALALVVSLIADGSADGQDISAAARQ